MGNTYITFDGQGYTIEAPSAALLDLKRFVHVVALLQESHRRIRDSAKAIVAAKDDSLRVDALLDENYAQSQMLEVLFNAAERQVLHFLGSFENSQSLIALAYHALQDDMTKKIDFFYAFIKGFQADAESTKKS